METIVGMIINNLIKDYQEKHCIDLWIFGLHTLALDRFFWFV